MNPDEPTGQLLLKGFITYAHDDDANTGFVEEFHQAFERHLALHLGRYNLKPSIFLDAMQGNKFGQIEEYYRTKASQVDFLIILMGDYYYSRQFCLA